MPHPTEHPKALQAGGPILQAWYRHMQSASTASVIACARQGSACEARVARFELLRRRRAGEDSDDIADCLSRPAAVAAAPRGARA